MVGVENKQNIEGTFEHRVRLVFELGHLEQHVEKISGVAQVVVGIRIRQAKAMPISEGSQGRHLADQPVSLIVARVDVENFLGFGVKRRQCAYGAD